MKTNKIYLLICLILLSCHLQAQPNERQQINRLVSLAKLWSTIKYFHPSLAYEYVNWDSSLATAVPKVMAATNDKEYAMALAEMLSVLKDPVTNITYNKPDQVADNRSFDYRFTEDSILVITAGSYLKLYSGEAQRKIMELNTRVSGASVCIIDLRTTEKTGEYGKLALFSAFSNLERSITTKQLIAPGQRFRLHRGYENQSGFISSGQYQSKLVVENGKRIIPARNAKDIPVIFILNRNSEVLPSMYPLQASGKALIAYEGDINEFSTGQTEQIEMGEGLLANVRLTEPISIEGNSAGLQADRSFPETESASIVGEAIVLARNYKSSSLVKKPLPAVATSFPEKTYPEMRYPDIGYRMLSIYRLWSAINYFFPYKNLLERDWDDVLREFIPKFMNAKDSLEYSLAVAEMATHIHDSHAYVSGKTISDYYGTGYSPIRVRMIEGLPVITSFRNDSIARSAGLSIGDIIIKVDGEDANTRLQRYYKYIAASTVHNRMYRAAFGFMNGAPNSIVTLTVKDKYNKIKEVNLPRRYEDYYTLYNRERSGEMIKLLPGNIGYVDLDRYPLHDMDKMLEQFKTTKAIIFDMRGYPKGDFFWFLTPRLALKENTPAALLETPLVSKGNQLTWEGTFQFIQPKPTDKWTYKGKTVLLVDERAVSQSEHTGLFFQAANNTKIIGTATGGANGEITTILLPGNMAVGFSGQSARYPNGKQLQRKGLQPDIIVKETISGIRNGKDEILEAAIKYLSGQ
ncbi:MAG TPA: S41 family peptidase [Chitinophagaceae bacterium]|nr:S41 family peptidase [Chitinophagaceae bacterium]